MTTLTMGPRRAARLARAAQLRLTLHQRAAERSAQHEIEVRQMAAQIDALPPETPNLHIAEVQVAIQQGAYARLPHYRFRCTCHRRVEDFGGWTRDRKAAEKERDEHLVAVRAVPVEAEAA